MEKTKSKGVTVVQKPIVVLEWQADYLGSMKKASDKNGRMVTLKEFVIGLKDDPTLLERTIGRSLWLGGERGLEIQGYCELDKKKGALVPISEEEWYKLEPRDRAYAHRGEGPLHLRVEKDGSLVVSANLMVECCTNLVARIENSMEAGKARISNIRRSA